MGRNYGRTLQTVKECVELMRDNPKFKILMLTPTDRRARHAIMLAHDYALRHNITVTSITAYEIHINGGIMKTNIPTESWIRGHEHNAYADTFEIGEHTRKTLKVAQECYHSLKTYHKPLPPKE